MSKQELTDFSNSRECEVIKMKDLYNILIQDHRLSKLLNLLDSIESIDRLEDGSIYMKYKKHVIVEANGSIVRYSRDNHIIDKAKSIHFNPMIDDIRLNDLDHIEVSDLVSKEIEE